MALSAPTAPDLATAHKIRLKGGISESWDSSGPKATVVYRCHWADRYDLARNLMGGYPPGATGFTSYEPPHAYPPSPNMFCTSIGSIEGLGARKVAAGGSKWLPYRLAEVSAVYSVPTYDVSSPSAAGQVDPANPILYCRQRIRASSQFVVLPKRKLKYSTSGKTVESEVGKPAAQAEITLEFPKVPFNPYQLVKPYLGKVNEVAMLGHPPGCLYFDAIDTDTGASTDGSIDNAVVLSFLGRDEDWNKLLNESGDYEFIEYVDGGAKPFEYADFWDFLR